MNEEQTKHDKITSALKEAGWDRLPFRLALEQQVAPGRIEHDGRSHKPERADYVRDGVWTLTAESFRDLLMQRYASIGGAYQALGFDSPAAAMTFYGDLQRELYAA